jgi:hypothetical protein
LAVPSVLESLAPILPGIHGSLWLKPKSGASYRTLEETRADAKAFINRQLSLQGPQTGTIARFAPLDQSVANWFTIIGDSGLRVTDL